MKKIITIAIISLMFPVSALASELQESGHSQCVAPIGIDGICIDNQFVTVDTAPTAVADVATTPSISPVIPTVTPSIGPALPNTPPVTPTEPTAPQSNGGGSSGGGRGYVQSGNDRIQYLLSLVGVWLDLFSKTIK